MNHVSLTGRLVADPQGSSTQSTDRAFFRLAIDREGDGRGTDFIPVTCFGGQANAVLKHIGKGHLVAVDGRLQSSSYERDGERVYSLEVVARRVEFLKAPQRQPEDAA
jgi:single-strand DNA-binding protein